MEELVNVVQEGSLLGREVACAREEKEQGYVNRRVAPKWRDDGSTGCAWRGDHRKVVFYFVALVLGGEIAGRSFSISFNKRMALASRARPRSLGWEEMEREEGTK